MRRLVLFLIGTVLSFSQVLNAQQISESEAKDKALSFFNSRPSTTYNGALRAPARGSADADVQLAYKATDGTNNFFYVYNNGDNDGFVIIGGDAVANEILAYSDHGHFDYDPDKMPINLQSWLSFYNQEISSVTRMARKTTENNNHKDNSGAIKVDIPDLLSSKWGQGSPFNFATPTTPEDGHCPTGCSATAIAQIMNYWKYPQSGFGVISYSDAEGHELSADFENTTYDWNNMPDTCGNNTPQIQIDAVSTLMYHVGVSVYTQYSMCSGTTFVHSEDNIFLYGREAPALVEIFGYDENIIGMGRRHYSTEEWETLIYDELLHDRPVLYLATPDTLDGHDFIIHGYDADNNMFSVNWGWGGAFDGYYSLSVVNPNFQYYLDENVAQFMYVGIQPPGRERNPIERGDRFVSDGLYYNILSPTHKTVELSYFDFDSGPYDSERVDTFNIPTSVMYLGEEYTVERLGLNALKTKSTYQYPGNKYTEEIDCLPRHVHINGLPSSIKTIGYMAFKYVSNDSLNLSNVIHVSPHAFSKSNIKQVVWSSSLATIPICCFEQSDSLKRIIIPEGVVRIESSALQWCHNLENVDLPSSLEYIGFDAFNGCSKFTHVDIPELVTFVGLSAYEGCNRLYELYCHPVVPPFNGYRWGGSVFYGIATNTEDGVLYVPQNSISAYSSSDNWKEWQHIEALETAPQPSLSGETFSVDGIEYMILSNLVVVNGLIDDIHDLYIPAQVTYLGTDYPIIGIAERAFMDKDIRSITIEYGCKYIGMSSFMGCPLGGNIIIPGSVKEIGEYAFANNSSRYCDLSRLNLPEGLKVIGFGAFANSIINTMIIPESVEKIDSWMFVQATLQSLIIKGGHLDMVNDICAGCDSLKHVVLPQDFIYTGTESVFPGCKNIEDIVLNYCPSSSEELSTRFPFPPFKTDSTKCILYVPETSIEIYKNTQGWNVFAEIRPIIRPTDITINETLDLYVGQQISIEPSFAPNNTTVKYCNWTSTNSSVVSIDNYGVVTATGVGTTTIIATSMYYPELSDTCVVTVTNGSYTLTYMVDDEVFYQDTIEYNGTISLPTAPEKEGYIFVGWLNLPETMPAHDITVTGSFTINKYLLTYKVDGETISSDSIAYGTSLIAKQEPTKEGYTFSGWSEIPATMPANDITVTGSFTINSYVITYMVDGEVFYQDTIEYYGTISLPTAPEKEGYKFVDWLDLPQTMPAHDVTVTANFTIDDGIIEIDLDDSYRVYDLTGKFLGEMTDEDLKLLKPGVYIVNNKKLRVK